MGMFDGLVSAAVDFFGGERANSANSANAQRQMDFQQYNSDTSYVRRVKDLKMAGLNPMLAVSQGGASTPNGAMAKAENTLGPAVNTGIKAANSSAQRELIGAEIDKTMAETNQSQTQAMLNAALERKADAETTASGAAAIKAGSETDHNMQLIKESIERSKEIIQSADLKSDEAKRVRQETANAIKTGNNIVLEGKSIEERTALTKIQRELDELKRNAAKNASDYEATSAGRLHHAFDSKSKAFSAWGDFWGSAADSIGKDHSRIVGHSK